MFHGMGTRGSIGGWSRGDDGSLGGRGGRSGRTGGLVVCLVTGSSPKDTSSGPGKEG